MTLTATPHKLAHRVEVTNEVIDDSEPSVTEVLSAHLATMLGLKLDRSIFEGTGTAPEIRGIKNVAGTQTVSMGTNGGPVTDLDPVADAIGLLEQANVAPPYVAVMHARTWGAIRKLKEQPSGHNKPLVADPPSSDAPQRVFGANVYASSQLSVSETQGSSSNASSIYVYAPSEVVLVRQQ